MNAFCFRPMRARCDTVATKYFEESAMIKQEHCNVFYLILFGDLVHVHTAYFETE